MALLKWLGFIPVDAAGESADILTEVEGALASLTPERARFVAAFAYLLARVSRADHEVSGTEMASMSAIVAEFGALPGDQAELAVRLATARGLRFGGTDDFLVSREFSKLATRDEKLALLEALFAVSAADESIRTTEDNEIRRIVAEMQMGHEDFISARRQYEEHLASRRVSS